MHLEVQGAQESSRRFARLAENARDLTPGFKEFGEWAELETRVNIVSSREFEGGAFAPLAPGTIKARLAKRGALKEKASGDFTKAALKRQAKFFGLGGMRPLIDSGRTLKSVRVRASKHRVLWSARGHLTIAMTGGRENNPPRRNPTPFNRKGNRWVLSPRAAAKLRDCIERAVFR